MLAMLQSVSYATRGEAGTTSFISNIASRRRNTVMSTSSATRCRQAIEHACWSPSSSLMWHRHRAAAFDHEARKRKLDVMSAAHDIISSGERRGVSMMIAKRRLSPINASARLSEGDAKRRYGQR